MNLEIIKSAISSIISLSDKEWANLSKYLEVKFFEKNSYLLKEGQVCKSIAFINRGTLVYFKQLENGKEITTDFAFCGDWVTDNQSRLNNSPSYINIKAIEESEVLMINNENLDACYYQIPKLERLGRILIEQAFVKITQQSINLQTLTASERYEKLLQEHPEIFQKISLYHIANYLGIAPKSLSRIRKG